MFCENHFKKTHVFEVLIFLKTPSLHDKLFENFTLPNSFIILQDLKRGIEIFLIDHYAGDIGNKTIAGKQ